GDAVTNIARRWRDGAPWRYAARVTPTALSTTTTPPRIRPSVGHPRFRIAPRNVREWPRTSSGVSSDRPKAPRAAASTRASALVCQGPSRSASTVWSMTAWTTGFVLVGRSLASTRTTIGAWSGCRRDHPAIVAKQDASVGQLDRGSTTMEWNTG